MPTYILPQFLCILMELKYFPNCKLTKANEIFLTGVIERKSKKLETCLCLFFSLPMTNPCLFSMKLMSKKYYIFSVGNRRLPSAILVRTPHPFNHTFHFGALKSPLPRTTS